MVVSLVWVAKNENRDYSGFGVFRLPILLGNVHLCARVCLAFQAAAPICAILFVFLWRHDMNENQNLPDAGDDFDDLDNLFAQFDGMAVEGGVDAANEEDDCAGGACKI
jgi:hypothetical protein